MARISAGNRLDLARALGWLHAQERFFQMDILRRDASGRLAELFGRVALARDKSRAIHQFHSRARSVVSQLPSEQQTLLKVYTEGVNAGLAALNETPFEYIALQQSPQVWQMEDSLLVAYAMYFTW